VPELVRTLSAAPRTRWVGPESRGFGCRRVGRSRRARCRDRGPRLFATSNRRGSSATSTDTATTNRRVQHRLLAWVLLRVEEGSMCRQLNVRARTKGRAPAQRQAAMEVSAIGGPSCRPGAAPLPAFAGAVEVHTRCWQRACRTDAQLGGCASPTVNKNRRRARPGTSSLERVSIHRERCPERGNRVRRSGLGTVSNAPPTR